MRTALSLFLSVLLYFVNIAYAENSGLSYQLDQQATAQAPWQPGQTIGEGMIRVFPYDINSYRKFIGITTKGHFVVQDFYKQSNNKLTDPFVIMKEDFVKSYVAYKDEIRLVEYVSTPINSTLTVWFENGHKMIERHYLNNKREGNVTYWYENGQKKEESYYLDNRANGLQKNWFDTGELLSIVTYENGQLHGSESRWHKNEQIHQEGHNQKGKREGVWTSWYSNGQKESEYFYKNGQRHGAGYRWHENGEKHVEGSFNNGNSHGTWTIWDKNGQISELNTYDNGHKILQVWYEKGEEVRRQITSPKFDLTFRYI